MNAQEAATASEILKEYGVSTSKRPVLGSDDVTLSMSGGIADSANKAYLVITGGQFSMSTCGTAAGVTAAQEMYAAIGGILECLENLKKAGLAVKD